jgi:hypothetical protein
MYILFFALFIISFSPSLLVRLTTGSIDRELDDFYFERRMQAMALFVGIGLLLAGLKALKRREIILKSRLFRDAEELEIAGSDLEITGKDAFNYGITLIAVGILATVWSLFFWVKYIIPVIF